MRQLRAEVEEWDAKETQKKMTAMNAAVSMAEKERDARKAVAERTRALLNEARGGTPAGGQPAVAGSPPAPRGTVAGLAGGPNFDELAFLNSVVGRTSTPAAPMPRESKPVAVPAEIKESASAPAPAPASVAAPAVPASPAPPPPPAVQVAPQTVQPSLELVQGLPEAKPEPKSEPKSEARSEPTTEAKPEAKPELKLESQTEPASASTPKAAAPAAAEPEPAADDEPQSALGRPTPRTTQAVKTLKCAECGSFNYPTEWYCERCGGELAAL